MQRIRLISAALLLSMALPAALAPSTTLAQPAAAPTKEQQDESAARFKKGIDLVEKKKDAEAIVEFLAAYKLVPDFNIQFNLAQVYNRQQDYTHALDALQRYLHEGGNNIAADRKVEVGKDIVKLRTKVASVEISTSAAGVQITIDDAAVGVSPLPTPIAITPGQHKITVSAPSQKPTTKLVEVSAGDQIKLALDPVPGGSDDPKATAAASAVAAPASTKPAADGPPATPPGHSGCGSCTVATPTEGGGALLAFAVGGLALTRRKRRR